MDASFSTDDIDKIIARLSNNDDLLINDLTIDCAATMVFRIGEKENPDVYWVSSLLTSDLLVRRSHSAITTSHKLAEILSNKRGVFFPIFNPTIKHWSLMFYYGEKNTIYHYDSILTLNQSLSEKIMQLIIDNKLLPREPVKLIQVPFAIQQEHDWECGYYLLYNAMFITSKSPIRPIS